MGSGVGLALSREVAKHLRALTFTRSFWFATGGCTGVWYKEDVPGLN